MPSREKARAPKEILDLVARFEQQFDAHKSGRYNETGCHEAPDELTLDLACSITISATGTSETDGKQNFALGR